MKTVTPSAAARSKHPERPGKEQARFAFTVLLAINILNYADRYVLPAILPAVQKDLHINTFEAGLLSSAFLLVYGLSTLPLGVWADRTKRKNIVSLCVGIWSVATVLSGFTRSFIQLFTTRAILGIGEAGYAPASLSLLGDYFSKEHRGRILSYWSSGTLIGAAIGFTIGGLIADRLGWRWAFYVVGIPGLIAAFLAWRMHEPERGVSDAADESSEEAASTMEGHGSLSKDFWPSARAIMKVPTYLTLVGALIFSFFTIGGTSVWLPTYLYRDFKLTLTQAGLVSGAILVGSGLIGTVLGGWLADRVQRARPEGRLFVAMLGFLIGAPLAFLALLFNTLPFFVATLFLAGIALNFCVGPLNAVIQDVIVPEVRATALGLSLLLAHLLGDAASPVIIGWIADGYSLKTALLVTAPVALLVAGLICLLGLRTVAGDMRHMQEQLRRKESVKKA
ncbi:MAG: MFS transporter [Ktedonobacteraceae bacterium]|nr:MFS transporter [Ktedonobacteraceae bacterium]